MGIDLWNLKFLSVAWRDFGNFGDMIQMGRQELHISENNFETAEGILRSAQVHNSFRSLVDGRRWADEGLFQVFGADNVHCADASDYEGADIIHDFNEPLDERHHQAYDLIFDGGSLEHIFNVPVAIANEMAMLKVGGRLLAALPANNWLGHSFYQFGPEFPFRVFTPENGFRMEVAFYSGMRENYELVRTEDLARRAGAEIGVTQNQVSLYYIATKTAHVEPFRKWPQQGDYSRAWESSPTPEVGRVTGAANRTDGGWLANLFGGR